MRLFMLLLLRLVVLAFAYGLATLVAAIFLMATLYLNGEFHRVPEDVWVTGGAILVTIGFWLDVAIKSFYPAVFVIAGLEFGQFRGLTINLITSGLMAVIVLMLSTNGSAPIDEGLWLAGLAAGFTAGATYWMLAGHRAGRWME